MKAFTYDYIHNTIKDMCDKLVCYNTRPFDMIVAIGSGGFIPARIFKTFLDIPILCLNIQFYNNEDNSINKEPKIIQWIEEEAISRKDILIVDEVDDTRTTIKFVVDNLKDACRSISVAVVHNKIGNGGKEELGIPYYYGEEISGGEWIVYPWENV